MAKSNVGEGLLSVVEVLIIIVVSFLALRFLSGLGSTGGGGSGPGASGNPLGNLLSGLLNPNGQSGGSVSQTGNLSANFPGPSIATGNPFSNSLYNDIQNAWGNIWSAVDDPNAYWNLQSDYANNESAIDDGFNDQIPFVPLVNGPTGVFPINSLGFGDGSFNSDGSYDTGLGGVGSDYIDTNDVDSSTQIDDSGDDGN